MIERLMNDLERRIDPDIENSLLAEWEAFAAGSFTGQFFSPGRPAGNPPAVEWPPAPVNATLDDEDMMALQQLGMCSEILRLGWGAPLGVRANYGTGIMPSLFGAQLFIMPEELDTLPTSRPLGKGLDGIKALLDRGVPDIHGALGGKVFRMGERFHEIGRRYPKIGEFVHVYHPDAQGPMDICELLWGSELFVDIYDEPELVHDLLALVTETYILFMRAWQDMFPPAEYNVHWSFLHRGSIMLRDDSAMNFSPQMFSEFILPYDQRLLDAFGGGAVHFCGKGDHYIEALSTMRGLHAVNLSQPEYNDMETIFRHTIDKGIELLGLPRTAIDAALAEGRDLRGRVQA